MSNKKEKNQGSILLLLILLFAAVCGSIAHILVNMSIGFFSIFFLVVFSIFAILMFFGIIGGVITIMDEDGKEV